MAKERTKSFPMLPVQHWWTLRDKFKQSIPGVVTAKYLATVLKIQPNSARSNVLSYLKDMGLTDEEGKPQVLAKAWRDDAQYADVCQEVRKQIYPEELIDAVPDPATNRQAVQRWFANETGLGQTAVARMTGIYIVLSEGDASKRPEKKVQKEGTAKKSKVTAKTEKTKPAPTPPPSLATRFDGTSLPPGLNINLEIHISSDATPDQIDKIFESMAKHIYRK